MMTSPGWPRRPDLARIRHGVDDIAAVDRGRSGTEDPDWVLSATDDYHQKTGPWARVDRRAAAGASFAALLAKAFRRPHEGANTRREDAIGITYEVRAGIAYLGFNRPEKHNALRDEDLEALSASLGQVDGDDDVDVAILFGHGRSFSSGGDLEARLQRSLDEGSTDGRASEDEGFFGCRHWKPVIAAVHGYCFGHALQTALLCDLLVAGRDAVFEVTETKIGLPMPFLLGRLGQPAFAYDVAMTARRFTAAEAHAGGMLSRLADRGGHIVAAEGLARELQAVPSQAVRSYVKTRRQEIIAELARTDTSAIAEAWASDQSVREAVEKQRRVVSE
jgi:enoyl-CoA hydratase/carnithine racemase